MLAPPKLGQAAPRAFGGKGRWLTMSG
jgi:Low affinity iron permease